MAYAAYQDRDNGLAFSFLGRDEALGILGTFKRGVDPVAVAETLDELRLRARAHLGDFPAAVLYLTDAENHVREILLNKKYHAEIERLQRIAGISIALLGFCVTCLLVSPLSGRGVWGLYGFVGVALLYLGTVKLGIYNEVEGAVVSEIILIVVMALILALH